MPHPFDFDALWNKAKLFMERGLTARSEKRDEEWPLWASLAAELLGKAVLAKRHPVLVAHPGSEDEANSLLSAAGVPVKMEGLQSIPMKSVVSRLGKVLPIEFEKAIQKDLMLVANLRNEELHSGATPFTGLNEHSWSPGFWRAIDILLRDIGRTVEDFVGPDFAVLVTGLIEATKNEIDAEVKKRTGLARDRWKVRSEDNGGPENYKNIIASQMKLTRRISRTIVQDCPVCGCPGRLFHDEMILSEARRIRAEQVVYDHRYRAAKFKCEGCSLQLEGTAQLAKAGLPVDSNITEDFSIEWEPDYGND